MTTTQLRIIDAAATQLAATINGTEWIGIRCHLDGDTLVIDGDGEIPGAYRGALAAGVVPEPYTPPPATSADVDRERDRRILSVEFGGHTFDGDELSLARIDRAKSTALAAIINGAQPGNLRWADAGLDFAWITQGNVPITMDAQTCLAFGLASAAWEGKHIVAARALKNMSPIPADYATNPAYWPQAE